MTRYRSPPKGCFVCGAQYPNEVVLGEDYDLQNYYCPKCQNRILTGIVSESGVPARVPGHMIERHDEIIFDEDTDWATAEKWWTNRMEVAAIHGRVVSGDSRLLDFVKEVQRIHDS